MSQHSIAYEAARRRAAFLRRVDRGRIVVSGADRRSYLQGLFTNDIAALKAGEGCYTAYLTAQGRMIADLWVYELGDVLLLTMSADVKDTVIGRLDQFIFGEDVQLGDVTGTLAQIAVVGPEAATAIARLLSAPPASVLTALAEHGNIRGERAATPVVVTRTSDIGVPGFDMFIDGALADAVVGDLRHSGVPELDPETSEAIRVEGGVARFHRDMDEETIPLEAGIESRAISFTKGCYVGQEVIIRVLHRGHGRVARKLVGLRISGGGAGVPAAGTRLRAGDRDVGEVTSAAFSPALSQPIALGYVHRDFVEPGTKVEIDGGGAAEVTTLPFTTEATVDTQRTLSTKPEP